MSDAHEEAGAGFGFLYRTDAGRIGRAVWWRGVATLALPLVVLTGIWLALAPYTRRELTKGSALIEPAAFAAYAYLLVYAFAVIFIAISFYNLSAKRFRDRARPPSLAGLVPLFAFLAGAVHWFVPQSEGTVPYAAALAVDALLIAAIGYTVWELGFGADGAGSGAPARR